ncbi:MAG: NEAT domain-containing protein [Romboutsia sp.]|nr:NEAT domain-containing protein [Romboutsia sp.]
MKYIKSILSIMLVTIFMITSGINANALEISDLESGVYTAQNDVQHESEVGMSMSRSYLDPTMKIKIKDGKAYYTIKFSGANYMENHRISVNGKAVSLDVVSKDSVNHTIEFGFETNTINPTIKASMYVGPMGRDVEFGIITKTSTLNLIEKIEEPKNETVKEEVVEKEETVKEDETKEEEKQEVTEENKEVTEKNKEENTEEVAKEENTEEVVEEATTEVKAETKTNNNTILYVGIGVVVVIAAVVLFFINKGKK